MIIVGICRTVLKKYRKRLIGESAAIRTAERF
jgi:hypothetical protein